MHDRKLTSGSSCVKYCRQLLLDSSSSKVIPYLLLVLAAAFTRSGLSQHHQSLFTALSGCNHLDASQQHEKALFDHTGQFIAFALIKLYVSSKSKWLTVRRDGDFKGIHIIGVDGIEIDHQLSARYRGLHHRVDEMRKVIAICLDLKPNNTITI